MNNFKEMINRDDISYDKMLKMILHIRTDYLKIYKSFTKEEIDTLITYKRLGYLEINELLYSNIISDIYPLNKKYLKNIVYITDLINEKYNSLVEHITILDNIIKKYSLKKEIKVFRGYSGKLVQIFNKLKINEEITMDSFLSTSFSPMIAFNFTWGKIGNYKKIQKNQQRHLIEITLQKNTNFTYLQWDLKNKKKNERFIDSEFEILLERGCVLKLDKISTIEHRFFKLNDMNWKKYINTKNKVKQIKIFHMSISKKEYRLE